MSADVRVVLEYAATHACMRGRDKREACVCAPCRARRLVCGANDPVQVQESMRRELAEGRSLFADLYRRIWVQGDDAEAQVARCCAWAGIDPESGDPIRTGPPAVATR